MAIGKGGSYEDRYSEEDPQGRMGATAIEYGLIAALVSVAAIGALTAMGGSLNTMFTTVSTALATAVG